VKEKVMSAVFHKLNLKEPAEILVLNAPESFQPELDALGDIAVHSDLDEVKEIAFVLSFVTQQEQVDRLARQIAPKARGDALVWFAYPKSSSKKYRCDFNRDTGWDVLGRLGFEPVRQVAIDQDWSALRFRRVEFIKSLSRDQKRLLSEQGRQRTGGEEKA
jgi:hypothetical protein